MHAGLITPVIEAPAQLQAAAMALPPSHTAACTAPLPPAVGRRATALAHAMMGR